MVYSVNDVARYAPGFENLSNEEHIALQDSTIFWTLFEAQVLDSHASVRKIKQKTQEWCDAGILDGLWFQEQLEYFTDRYVEGGGLGGCPRTTRG